MKGGSRRWTSILFVVLGLSLSLLVGLAVALPDYLPTCDGPQHVFSIHAAGHLDDAAAGYGRFLKPGGALAQIGFGSIFAFWEVFFSWRGALRASLVTMSLLWAWGVVFLAAALGGRRGLGLGLFGFATALQWLLYMGFFPFYVAAGFGFWVLALALWRKEWNLLVRVGIAAGLACQALLHPIPAVCGGVVLVMIGWSRQSVSGLGRETGRLLLMVAPAAALVLAGTASDGPRTEYWNLPLIGRAAMAVRAFVSGPLWRSAVVPLCALWGAAATIATRAWRADRRRGALLVAGLLFAAVAVVAPFHMTGWQFVNVRFSPLACVLLAVLIPVERWSRATRTAGFVLLLGYAAAANLWALHYGLQLRRASADLLAGLDAPIHRSGVRLPLIIEPRAGEPQDKASRTFPFATTNWNIGSIFAVQQGGVPAWSFAESASIHAVVWRWPEQLGMRPPRPERGFEWGLSQPEVLDVPGARKAEVNYLLSFAPYYEDVIFYGRPSEIAWLRERRFDIDYQRGGLAIARFRACPAALELAPGPHGHPATNIQFGWAPSTRQSFSVTLAAEPGAHQARRWMVSESPCGDVWFRVLFDEDGDGRASPGDERCAEGNRDGVLSARIEVGASNVLCTPGQVIGAAERQSTIDQPK